MSNLQAAWRLVEGFVWSRKIFNCAYIIPTITSRHDFDNLKIDIFDAMAFQFVSSCHVLHTGRFPCVH